jgi:hypothetical protein
MDVMATRIRPAGSRIDVGRDNDRHESETPVDVEDRHRAFFQAFDSDRTGGVANSVGAEGESLSSLASSAEIGDLFQAFSRIPHADVRRAIVQFAVALAPDQAPRG